MKNRKKKNILFMLIILLMVTVGFALLSTTLNIIGTAGIKSNRWDIHWDDTSISETIGSVTATTPAAVTDTDKKNVSFEVEFELPGDFYEFTVDAKNYGTVDGAISSFKTNYYEQGTTESSDIPSYLNFSVTYVDGGVPTEGDILAAGESKKYKVRVEFKSSVEELPSNPPSGRFEIETIYVQTKDEVNIKEGDYVWFNPIEYEFCEEGTQGCLAWIALKKTGDKYDLLYRDNESGLVWNQSNIKTIIDGYTYRWSDKLKVIDNSYNIIDGNNKYEFSESKARLLTIDEYNYKDSIKNVINQHCGYMSPSAILADYNNTTYCYISNGALSCSFISFSQNFGGSFANGMYIHPVVTIDSKEVIDGSKGNNTKYNLGEIVYFDPVSDSKCDSTTFSVDAVKNNTSTCYKWRVVTPNDNLARNKIKLQLDHNLINKAAWSSTYMSSNYYGPDTSLAELEIATNNWVRVNPITYTYDESGYVQGKYYGYYWLKCTNGECNIKTNNTDEATVVKVTDNLRARMISGDEVIEIMNYKYPTSGSLNWNQADGVNNHPPIIDHSSDSSELAWMIENTYGTNPELPGRATNNKYDVNNWGYWTLSSSSAHMGSAWYIYYDGFFNIYPTGGVNDIGIRPLIEIEKNKITRD